MIKVLKKGEINMPLRHNPQIGRGLIKFTFRSGDQSIKTSFFARRVNEYISPNDTLYFRNGYTFGDIVNSFWNAKARGDFNDEFVASFYRIVFGCEPISDQSTRNTLREVTEVRPDTFEEVITQVADSIDDPVEEAVTTTAEAIANAVREEHTRSTRPRRHLERGYYHQNGQGTSRHGLQQALNRIQTDSDGVKRSFGIEYEIYTLTAEQESDLCYLLDELPPCKPEMDGSLGTNGVELVFDPVGKDDYIRIVRTLRRFLEENRIYMPDGEAGRSSAGMHTTYGVSNSHARDTDTIRVGGYTVPLIQARLNRISSLMKVCATKQQIKTIFGRYFTGYAQSSFSQGECNYLRYNAHENSMSINGRAPVDHIYTCWEFRLLYYKCDPEKVVDFFKATEWVFHRTMHVEDATAMLNAILPSNTVED